MLKKSFFLIVGLLSMTLLAGACAKLTPEERTAQTRARYFAELNGFVVLQQPIEEEADPMNPPAGDELAAGDGGEEPWEASVDLSQDVLLDIVIRHDSFDKLPWLTVDITMADGDRELQNWRVWFETGGIEKGPGVQFSHTLENVDYEPGFGFSAEVRSPVPPEDRSEYREFFDTGG